jgi:hypothetical protein
MAELSSASKLRTELLMALFKDHIFISDTLNLSTGTRHAAQPSSPSSRRASAEVSQGVAPNGTTVAGGRGSFTADLEAVEYW